MITTDYISFVTSLLSSLLGLGIVSDLFGDFCDGRVKSYFAFREKCTCQTPSSPCGSGTSKCEAGGGSRSHKSCGYCGRY